MASWPCFDLGRTLHALVPDSAISSASALMSATCSKESPRSLLRLYMFLSKPALLVVALEFDAAVLSACMSMAVGGMAALLLCASMWLFFAAETPS